MIFVLCYDGACMCVFLDYCNSLCACTHRYTVSKSVSSDDQFAVISLVHITEVQTEDLSTYNCTAVNDQGVMFVIITLHVKGLSICVFLSLSLCPSHCLCLLVCMSN